MTNPMFVYFVLLVGSVTIAIVVIRSVRFAISYMFGLPTKKVERRLYDCECYANEQRRIKEAFDKSDDYQNTMLVLENMFNDGKHIDKKGRFTKRFLDFAYHAHCLLYPERHVKRCTISLRLRNRHYKSAINKTPFIHGKTK